MDALASADNVLEQNDASRAAASEPKEQPHSQLQTGEDNKFQQAISSWRSMCICALVTHLSPIDQKLTVQPQASI